MKWFEKGFITTVFVVFLGVLIQPASAAYPDKPIKMLIGYAPGSSTDIVGRIIANDLSLALKQPVIVENRGGAAGSLAADAVAKSAPDGYTVLFAQNGLAINVAANPKLPFNGQKDLIPVVGVAATPHILIVNNNSKVRSVADLIAALKAKTIAGAALDVRAQEPPVKGEMEQIPNLILTPHVAGITKESQLRINQILTANIELVLNSKPATHAVGALKESSN
ncbi:MAG: hypothetical protein RLY18_1273 [Pseudomonadota bacterium]